jgi:hypothetical protein
MHARQPTSLGCVVTSIGAGTAGLSLAALIMHSPFPSSSLESFNFLAAGVRRSNCAVRQCPNLDNDLSHHRLPYCSDMDVAGTAVGVASLGIQVCQGLLDYYQACKSFDITMQEAQRWIIHLQRTLIILGDVLQGANAKQDVFQNAQTGILNCEDVSAR